MKASQLMIPVATSLEFFHIVLEPPTCLETEIPAPGRGDATYGFVPHVAVCIDLPPAGFSAMLSSPPFGSRGVVYPAHRDAPVLLELFTNLSAETTGGQHAVHRVHETLEKRPEDLCPVLRFVSLERGVQQLRCWWSRMYVYQVCDKTGALFRAGTLTLEDLPYLRALAQRVLKWVVDEEFRIFRYEKDPADTSPAELFR